MIRSRALRQVGVALAGYLALWGMTATLGVPQVKESVLDSVRPEAGSTIGVPIARATSPAPLLVRVHYGDRTFDAVEWHLWVFPTHIRLFTERFNIF
jgi:hypothetical protein